MFFRALGPDGGFSAILLHFRAANFFFLLFVFMFFADFILLLFVSDVPRSRRRSRSRDRHRRPAHPPPPNNDIVKKAEVMNKVMQMLNAKRAADQQMSTTNFMANNERPGILSDMPNLPKMPNMPILPNVPGGAFQFQQVRS